MTNPPSRVEPASPAGVAVVIGASGGIGSALARQLAESGRHTAVLALSRRAVAVPGCRAGTIDLDREDSIAAAAQHAAALGGEVQLVIVATGALHGEGFAPEKTWAALDADAMARVFAINSIGPALVAKHFLPLLPRRGRSVFAALSARVGSIGDNRLGGWYAYRASKAALNMLLKTASIELARRAPEAICIGLHPGTVDTGLSQPFQANVAPGRLFSPDQAARQLLEVIDQARPEYSGRVFAWNGQVIAE